MSDLMCNVSSTASFPSHASVFLVYMILLRAFGWNGLIWCGLCVVTWELDKKPGQEYRKSQKQFTLSTLKEAKTNAIFPHFLPSCSMMFSCATLLA